MSWIKGPIPEDGENYVTAVLWHRTKDGTKHYELTVASVNEYGDLIDGTGETITSHDPDDIEYYLPIPPIPESK